MASGLIGDGRMVEPEHIIDFITKFFQKDQPYIGKKVLITAGPTHEPLDPVRLATIVVVKWVYPSPKHL
ncbi:MAG: phosphopantothenoylcysteine decarboxylase [Saprospiraceae bacterium]